MTATLGTDIAEAAALLKAGRLVAFPTETVYGLGANAMDGVAVARVFEAKQRPEFDPLIVHIADSSWLDRVVTDVPPLARLLMERFWPGPLTLVLPKLDSVPDLVSSGLDTVGVRQPAHPIAIELIAEAGTPIAAPSANLFGRISPTAAQHVVDQLADRIDYVFDGGSCSVGIESTVVAVDGDRVVVLRPGGLTLEALRGVAPKVEFNDSEDTETQHASPGRTLQHYAPRTALVVRESPTLTDAERHLAVGLLSHNPGEGPAGFAMIERLEPDLPRAAAEFFAALRRLDASQLDLIVATPFPEYGLGIALNDRLNRAAAGARPA